MVQGHEVRPKIRHEKNKRRQYVVISLLKNFW